MTITKKKAPRTAASKRGDHINDRIARRLKLEAKTVSSAPVTEKHFHIKDAARILGVSVWTLRHKMTRGDLRYRRIGMRVLPNHPICSGLVTSEWGDDTLAAEIEEGNH